MRPHVVIPHQRNQVPAAIYHGDHALTIHTVTNDQRFSRQFLTERLGHVIDDRGFSSKREARSRGKGQCKHKTSHLCSASPVGGVAVLAQQQRDVIGGGRIRYLEFNRDFWEKTLLFLFSEVFPGFKSHPVLSRFKGLSRP